MGFSLGPPLAPSPTRPDTTPMSPSNDERRFSEEEFALVLRMASEVQDGSDPASDRSHPREGLSLSEIQEIAAEVGIDPGRVSRAVALLPAGGDSAEVRLLGGGPRHRLEHSVSGEIREKDLGRIVEVARRLVGVQGEAREVLGAVEWSGSTSTTKFSISATPREGKTTLQASIDRFESLMGIYAGVGMGVLGVVAVTMGKLFFGESDAGIVAALLSGIPPAFLVTRTLWKRSSKKWRERLFHLMDAMAEEADVVVSRMEEGMAEGTEEGTAEGMAERAVEGGEDSAK